MKVYKYRERFVYPPRNERPDRKLLREIKRRAWTAEPHDGFKV